MPHSYTSIVSHLVFSTKNREPLIVDEIDDRLTEYLGGIIRGLNGSMIASGGWFDHRHVLARHPANLSVSDLARLIKTNSSKWIHENWPRLAGFGWQDGFGGFSVGRSELDRVETYIRNQKRTSSDRDVRRGVRSFPDGERSRVRFEVFVAAEGVGTR